jgi:hypothetical protein
MTAVLIRSRRDTRGKKPCEDTVSVAICKPRRETFGGDHAYWDLDFELPASRIIRK